MKRTHLANAFIAMALGLGLSLPGPANAGPFVELKLIGELLQGAGVAPTGAQLEAVLRYETLQEALSVDATSSEFGSTHPITATFSFQSLAVFIDGELLGRNQGGLIIERDAGNGTNITDTISFVGTPMLQGGPWITDTINYSALPATSVDLPLPGGSVDLMAVAQQMLLGPTFTSAAVFDGQLGELRLGLRGGQVLRGQFTQATGGLLPTTASEPLTLLLGAAGIIIVGALAGRARRRSA